MWLNTVLGRFCGPAQLCVGQGGAEGVLQRAFQQVHAARATQHHLTVAICSFLMFFGKQPELSCGLEMSGSSSGHKTL